MEPHRFYTGHLGQKNREESKPFAPELGVTCAPGRPQVSSWEGGGRWKLGPGPRPGPAIPLGPSLHTTPAAVGQVHLTPDVGNEKGKGKKRETPRGPTRFGERCQVRYITPAQADTCAGAGAGPGLAGTPAGYVGSGAPGPRGQGEEERIPGWKGGASAPGWGWGMAGPGS